jgi:opacity protein-like surface antigen
MIKKQKLAGIAVCILCFGAAVAEAQSHDDSSAVAGPYFHLGNSSPFFENGRLPNLGGPITGPTEYRPGSAMDAAMGWGFSQNEAAEVELGFAGASSNEDLSGFFSDRTHAANIPLLANYTLTLPTPNAALIPYLGAGVGGDDMVLGPDGFSDGASTVFRNGNDILFAWQTFAGMRLKMSQRMSLGFGYKYFVAGDPLSGSPAAPEFSAADGVRTHSVLFTFHLKF